MSKLRDDWNLALADQLEDEDPGHIGITSLLGRGPGCFIVQKSGDWLPVWLPKTPVARTWAEAAWMLRYIDRHTDMKNWIKLVDYGPLDYASHTPGLALVIQSDDEYIPARKAWVNLAEQIRRLPCSSLRDGGPLDEVLEHHFSSKRAWGYWEYRPCTINGTRYSDLVHVLQGYDVDIHSFSGAGSVLKWISHLSAKNPEVYGDTFLSDFVSALKAIFGDLSQLPYKFEAGKYLEAFEQRTKPQISRVPIPPKIRHQVFERDGFRCCDCGASPQEEDVRLEVDHKIPLARGGSNDIDNLRTLCRPCNIGKAARLIDYPDGHL